MSDSVNSVKRVLHAGCGGAILPASFADYEEVRLDIDAGEKPDIVASLTDTVKMDACQFDAIYCSHTLEHLYPHEVPFALMGFRHVLKDDGFAFIVVPDLEGVQATEDVLYRVPMGPVCGLDLIYGYHTEVRRSPHMAHHCGFTRESLKPALEAVGFAYCAVARLKDYNLVALAFKEKQDEYRARELERALVAPLSDTPELLKEAA